jgi:hypothetical protein
VEEVAGVHRLTTRSARALLIISDRLVRPAVGYQDAEAERASSSVALVSRRGGF